MIVLLVSTIILAEPVLVYPTISYSGVNAGCDVKRVVGVAVIRRLKESYIFPITATVPRVETDRLLIFTFTKGFVTFVDIPAPHNVTQPFIVDALE
jgi:hypothetical protein